MLKQTGRSIAFESEVMKPIANPNPDFRIASFRGRQGLGQIREDWTAITDRMVGHRHYFHLWEWHRDYMDTLASDPDAAVFHVAYLASVPIAILPLGPSAVRQVGFRFRVLETPYHKHMPLSDMVCDPDPKHSDIPVRMIDYLRNFERDGWDAILLRGLLAESSSVSRWGAALPGPRIQIMRSRCDSLHYASHEELMATVSKKFRNNLRYARNRLTKLGAPEFKFVRDPALLPEAYSQFLMVEASGWKGADGSGTAIALNPQLESFYRNLISSFGPTQRCQINLLMLEGVCIAGHFCLRLDGTLYVLKIGYSENYALLSPGHLLLEESICRDTIGVEPIRCWNLLGGLEWLGPWKPLQEAVCEQWIYNRTLRSYALYFWGKGIRLCRSIYHKSRKIRHAASGSLTQC